MKDITIKSITHCPTCNSECKVNGGTTQYYVPVKKYTEEDMINIVNKSRVTGLTAEYLILQLNKQD
jgi:hypothetical protein